MKDDVAISLEHVSKKFCRSLRHSMLYGLEDLTRNSLWLRSRSSVLRKREFWAVDDVCLDVKIGETIGLIGRNGSGKTTLLKMINGIFWPDKGRISVRGKVGALIAVGAGFHPLLTGRENVYINGAILGMNKETLDRNFDSIVDFAQIGDFLDTPVKHYSSGMYVRLGFAVAVHCEPDVMLVDEVLAVGDRGFQTKCFAKMGELREQGTTFVVVSHNMHTLAGFVDRVAVLSEGKAECYDNVFEGISRYENLFRDSEDREVERLLSSGKNIEFTDVDMGPRELSPGDSFRLSLSYVCKQAYEDVEVDIVVYDGRDPNVYFQATNHAYGQRVDLLSGSHKLDITLNRLQLNGSVGTVTMAIWSRGRTEQLFWWRIPLEFRSMPHATGRNFLPVDFVVAGT